MLELSLSSSICLFCLVIYVISLSTDKIYLFKILYTQKALTMDRFSLDHGLELVGGPPVAAFMQHKAFVHATKLITRCCKK